MKQAGAHYIAIAIETVSEKFQKLLVFTSNLDNPLLVLSHSRPFSSSNMPYTTLLGNPSFSVQCLNFLVFRSSLLNPPPDVPNQILPKVSRQTAF